MLVYSQIDSSQESGLKILLAGTVFEITTREIVVRCVFVNSHHIILEPRKVLNELRRHQQLLGAMIPWEYEEWKCVTIALISNDRTGSRFRNRMN